MPEYQRDRERVDKAIRDIGVVVVMTADHIKEPQHMVTTMWEVYQAGYVAEVTYRIDEGILKEGMQELTRMRQTEFDAGRNFVLGVGSVINPNELEGAIDMGFDMIVAPGNVMGGYGEGCDFVRRAHEAGVFAAPAILSPTELNYFIERDDGLEPDAIKVFPAGVHGPKGLSGLLAPYVRERHTREGYNARIIMPTGGVDYETGPEYQEGIASRGYFPALGMSAPLALVKDKKAPGDQGVIRESLEKFAEKFAEGGGVKPLTLFQRE